MITGRRIASMLLTTDHRRKQKWLLIGCCLFLNLPHFAILSGSGQIPFLENIEDVEYIVKPGDTKTYRITDLGIGADYIFFGPNEIGEEFDFSFKLGLELTVILTEVNLSKIRMEMVIRGHKTPPPSSAELFIIPIPTNRSNWEELIHTYNHNGQPPENTTQEAFLEGNLFVINLTSRNSKLLVKYDVTTSWMVLLRLESFVGNINTVIFELSEAGDNDILGFLTGILDQPAVQTAIALVVIIPIGAGIGMGLGIVVNRRK